MLNNLQSIARNIRCQLFDPPETDPLHYISNHPWIQRQYKQYRVAVSHPETWLAYFRVTRSIQLSISSLRSEVQAQLKSTLLSRLMVSDLTPHAYSIHWPILTSRYSLLTYDPTPGYDPTPVYDPTPGMPLNSECHLRITLEQFILLHSKHVFSFLNALNLWLPAHTECHLLDTKHLGAGAAHPTRPKQISKSMPDRCVTAAA